MSGEGMVPTGGMSLMGQAAPAPATSTPAGPGFLGQSAPAAMPGSQGQLGAQGQAAVNPGQQQVPGQSAPADASADNGSNFDKFFNNLFTKGPTQQNPPPTAPAAPAIPPAVAPSPTMAPADQQRMIMEKLGITPMTFTEQQTQQMAAGDFSPMQAMVSNMQNQMFSAMLKATGSLVRSAMAKAAAQNSQQTQDTIQMHESQAALRAALPFMNNPAFGPVGDFVMQKALASGVDQAAAIEMTRKYFEAASAAYAGQARPAQQNTNLYDPFSSNPQGAPGEMDWNAILSGAM